MSVPTYPRRFATTGGGRKPRTGCGVQPGLIATHVWMKETLTTKKSNWAMKIAAINTVSNSAVGAANSGSCSAVPTGAATELSVISAPETCQANIPEPETASNVDIECL